MKFNMLRDRIDRKISRNMSWKFVRDNWHNARFAEITMNLYSLIRWYSFCDKDDWFYDIRAGYSNWRRSK